MIDTICGERGEIFGRMACEYYERTEKRRCRMLREQGMDEFEKQCRLFYIIIDICHEKFQAVYPGLPISNDVAYYEVIQRIKARQPDFEDPAAWYAYIKRTAYQEIKKKTVKQGLLPDKHRCGSCKHFPRVKPDPCPKSGKIPKKTDLPCEEYMLDIGYPISIDENWQNDDTHLSAYHLLLEILEAHNNAMKASELLSEIETQLTEWAKEAAPNSKERRIRKVYRYLVERFFDDTAGKTPKQLLVEVVKELAKEFDKNEKTIRRDIEAMRNFSREHVLNDVNSALYG